jgi:hypothetical protein
MKVDGDSESASTTAGATETNPSLSSGTGKSETSSTTSVSRLSLKPSAEPSLNLKTETVPAWLLASVLRGAFIAGVQYESTEEHDYDELLDAATQYAQYALRGV